MLDRDVLAEYLGTYLLCDEYEDAAPQGLQIEGRAHIRRICTAVTASERVIEQAALRHADALLVHHGYFWRGEPAVLTGMKRRRIGHLIQHDINLYAYHLPLDGHPHIGNNACLGRLMGIEQIDMHRVQHIPRILWSGTLPTPMPAEEWKLSLAQLFQRPPLYIAGHTRPITRIAWCTGAAQHFIDEAARLGVDAFISGEVSERTYYQAQELGIDYVACGHHATERYGIQTLGQHLAMHFGVEHIYLETDNPI